MHNKGNGMQGAQQEGQNTRMVKRNMLLFMWAAGCGHRNPLEKMFFFLYKSAVTLLPQDNGKGRGGIYLSS